MPPRFRSHANTARSAAHTAAPAALPTGQRFALPPARLPVSPSARFSARPFSRLFARCFAPPAALLPALAHADSGWKLAPLVTPITHDTLHIHQQFMIVITVIFVLAFAIMLYSMIKHRRSDEHRPSRFFGPTGSVQWLWALVPFAILLCVNYALMEIPAEHTAAGKEVRILLTSSAAVVKP